MKDARHFFDKMRRKNVITWNALICGYGNDGQGEEAIHVFSRKYDSQSCHFRCRLIYTCRYSGLSERRCKIFHSTSKDHNIEPQEMHYATHD
jgi:pentatricopeptide repeat protein